MKQPLTAGYKPVFFILLLLAASTFSYAQSNAGGIDLGKDTISVDDAREGRDSYKGIIRAGKKKTEQIKLPVAKLKDVMDACALHNVTEVSVAIIALRQSDIARYRAHNPGSTATDNDLIGSQILVFKVPRRVFQTQSGAKNKISTSPLMVSLLAAGLLVMDEPLSGLPVSGSDVYLSFGSICPPPLSCDTFD